MKSSAILASISVLILTACGGGGGGGDKSPAPPPPAPPVANNSAQVQFDSGVFFFGLRATSNTTTYIPYITKHSNLTSSVPGTNLVAKTQYAGIPPDDMTPGLFSYVPWELGSQSWKGANPMATVAFGANNSASLSLSPPDSTMPNAKWDITITATDVSGTSIDKYVQSLPYYKPPTVVGIFGANAKLLSFTYTAADTLIGSYSGRELRDSNFKAVTDMSGLLDTTTCLESAGTDKSLVMRYQSNGTINLYDTRTVSYPDKCTFNPAVEPLLGVANFVQKSYGPHTYLEITFPASINLSNYQSSALTIGPTALDAGTKLAIVQRTTGNKNWSYGYVIPKGLQMKDPMQYMNQEAAASVKSALNLP
ncbi:hypothetical protein [Collimonas sp.]|jgi:hypothetical protein|uniref:hypothetical protein n=1 Tax=Collimonas sp. TaxID=1963772 RepID=UPI002CF30D87|nr:hypothetical protein [Collimonas sp.]HWW04050.1 hypothetical protein [Collimonas sp.]